jgi:hypothetical protein
MTKQQYKQFARLWVGQLLWEVKFDRNSVDCPDEEKDQIELAINEQFFRLLGLNENIMDAQEIYDLIMADDSF